MIEIIDPTNELKPVKRSLTRRPGKITGTLGLLDIRKARGDVLLDRLASQLLERLPDVEIKRYAKPTFAKPAPDELRRQILEEVDFVVEGLAD
jgi:hypothetical protein